MKEVIEYVVDGNQIFEAYDDGSEELILVVHPEEETERTAMELNDKLTERKR